MKTQIKKTIQRKIAKIIIVSSSSTMLIGMFLLVLLLSIYAAIFKQHPDNQTLISIQNSLFLFTKSNAISDIPADIIKWALNAFCAILYEIFIRPIAMIIDACQNIVWYIGGGALTNLIFTNSLSDLTIFWIILAICLSCFIVVFAVKLIEWMVTNRTKQNVATSFRYIIIMVIMIPALPIIFYCCNLIITAITQILLDSADPTHHNLGLIIFNNSFNNGPHNFNYIPPSLAFHDVGQFNFLICLVAECFMVYIMCLIVMFLFWRIFELALMYIASPFPVIMSGTDGGQKLRNWKEMVETRFISFTFIFLALNIFLWLIPILTAAGQGLGGFSCEIFILIGIITFALGIVKAPMMLHTMMGGRTSLTDAIGDFSSIKTATAGLFGAGLLAGKAGFKGAKMAGNGIKKGIGGINAIRDGAKKYGGVGNALKGAVLGGGVNNPLKARHSGVAKRMDSFFAKNSAILKSKGGAGFSTIGEQHNYSSFVPTSASTYSTLMSNNSVTPDNSSNSKNWYETALKPNTLLKPIDNSTPSTSSSIHQWKTENQKSQKNWIYENWNWDNLSPSEEKEARTWYSKKLQEGKGRVGQTPDEFISIMKTNYKKWKDENKGE